MKGIWRIYPSTLITEIIIKSDFDFQIFDCEHGTYDYTSLSEDIRICKLLNKKTIQLFSSHRIKVLSAKGLLREFNSFP